MKAGKKQEIEVDSDDSISDTDFDEYLMKTEQDGIDGKDDLDLDFAEQNQFPILSYEKKKEQEELMVNSFVPQGFVKEE